MTEKKTLHELAEANGQIAPPVAEGNPYLTGHRIASLIHGWAHFEHHFGPVLLTDETYKGALAAAEKGIVPHPDAVPVKPTDSEIAKRHAEALEASSETDETKKERAANAAKSAVTEAAKASAEAAAKVPDDAPTPAQEAAKLKRGLPATPQRNATEGDSK